MKNKYFYQFFIKLLLGLILFVKSADCQFSIYLDNTIIVNSKVSVTKLNKDARFLAYGMTNGNIILYDASAKRELHNFNKHQKDISDLIFDPDNKYLISASIDEKIIIWDLYSGNVLKTIEDFKNEIKCIDLSPDGRMLVGCGDNDEIFLWDFPQGKLRGTFKGHENNVMFVSFNANGDQILSVGEDNQMILWNVNQLKQIRKTEIEPLTMKNSGVDVKYAKCSFDKYFVGIGIQERVLEKGGQSMIFNFNMTFYEWNTGKELETIKGNNKDLGVFCISPDKNYLITDNSTLRENQLSFWNIQKGIVEQNYPIDGNITAIDMAENGKYMAVSFSSVKSNQIIMFQVSGIAGHETFNNSQVIQQNQISNFGGAIKLNTPSDPLIQLGERKKLAVMYFESSGVTEDVAKTATNLLESKLGNSKYVDMIERNQIDKVFAELKYQISGFTTGDAVDIGKQLNANYILIGSLNKLGNLIIITAKLVNVETTQIEGTREVQCSNATIENISDMVNVLAPTIVKF
jgi:WD40 repeat protein/TolB-like protein